MSTIPFISVLGKEIRVEGRLVRMARLVDEGFDFLKEPEAAVDAIKHLRPAIDCFTFVQSLPHTTPRYSYPTEWDNVAALAVSSYEAWWTRQIGNKTRNMVRRAEKSGVIVRETQLDDAFARGIWGVYNESAVRQGKRFWHFGKDIETVRRENSTFLERSVFIGAFLDSELIGFAKLVSDEEYQQAALMQIVSMVSHRDKAPTNALIAQAVRSCAARAIPYLVYSQFTYGKGKKDGLSDFKEHNGFVRLEIPRYYVPLTRMGRIGLKIGMHHRASAQVPPPLLTLGRRIRKAFFEHAK